MKTKAGEKQLDIRHKTKGRAFICKDRTAHNGIAGVSAPLNSHCPCRGSSKPLRGSTWPVMPAPPHYHHCRAEDCSRAGETAQQLKAPAVLPGSPSSVASTHIRLFTATCKWGLDPYFWPVRTPACAHARAHIKTKLRKPEKNNLY